MLSVSAELNAFYQPCAVHITSMCLRTVNRLIQRADEMTTDKQLSPPPIPVHISVPRVSDCRPLTEVGATNDSLNRQPKSSEAPVINYSIYYARMRYAAGDPGAACSLFYRLRVGRYGRRPKSPQLPSKLAWSELVRINNVYRRRLGNQTTQNN